MDKEIIQQSEPQEAVVPETIRFIDGVSVDIAHYFDVYPMNLNTREKEQLKYLYENAPGNTVDEKLGFISNLEMRLGQPSDGTRFGKVWGWMKTMNVSRIGGL